MGRSYKNVSKLGHADLHRPVSLEIGHTDLFGLLRICSLMWTQKVLQAMENVFPCQPLSRRVWLEISICYRAWRLNFNVWRVKTIIYGMPCAF